MGFKLPKDTPAMERELIYLLADLCVKWGFCIPPDSIERITKTDRYNDIDFALVSTPFYLYCESDSEKWSESKSVVK